MKRIILSLIAVLALSLTTSAQTPEIKYGAKAGLNISNITNTNGGSSLTSFHIGGVAEIFIKEKFSIQPELLYSAQGSSFDGIIDIPYNNTEIPVNVETSLKLNYINIPVMAKYYLTKGLNVQVGPQFGFLTSAKLKIDKATYKGQTLPLESNNQSVKDQFNSFDFGVNFGAGYELPVGVFFDARYNVGLSKVNKEGDASKNGVFQLSVGYKF